MGSRVIRYPYDLPSRDIVNWAVQFNVAMLEKAVQEINREDRFI